MKNICLMFGKFLFCVGFLIFTMGNLCAQMSEVPPSEYKSLVFDDVPGTYASYKMSQEERVAYIGLCAIGGNELAIRYYEEDTGVELLVLETFYTQQDSKDPSRERAVEGSVELIRGDFSHEGSSFVLPMVLGWIDEWLSSKDQFTTLPEYRSGQGKTHLFQFWIPLVQLREVTGADKRIGDITGFSTGEVSLFSVGLASSGTDPAFFEWKGESVLDLAKSENTKVVPTIDLGETKTISIDELEFELDSNWKQDEEGFWNLSLSGIEGALLVVDTIDINQVVNTDSFDLMKLYILGSPGRVLAEGLAIFSVDDLPCLFFRVQNLKTGQINIQYRLFVSRNEQFLSVIGLEIDEELYQKNKAYFDAILF